MHASAAKIVAGLCASLLRAGVPPWLNNDASRAAVSLHKPYKDNGTGGWVPQALIKDLKDVSGVVKLLSTAESKEYGVLAEVFHENGWASLPAIAMDLRARGYEVKVYRDY